MAKIKGSSFLLEMFVYSNSGQPEITWRWV